MKKSIWIFLLAVLVPSVVLGWLALRSAGEQQIILERRTAELYQKETENIAATVRSLIDEERRAFNETVRRLLAGGDNKRLAEEFPVELEKAWPRKAIGFAIAPDGRLASPLPQRSKTNSAWAQFILDNSSFLAGSTPATVYWVSGDELAKPETLRNKMKSQDGGNNAAAPNAIAANNAAGSQQVQTEPRSKAEADAPPKEAGMPQQKFVSKSSAPPLPAPAPAMSDEGKLPAKPADKTTAPLKKSLAQMPAKSGQGELQLRTTPSDNFNQVELSKQEMVLRNVEPQRVPDEFNRVAASQLNAAMADFRELTTGTDEGVITRFVQDRLEIIFWIRPAQAADMIFGCLVQAADLRELWSNAFPQAWATSSTNWVSRGDKAPEFILALLDDKARPVATQPSGAVGRDWKHPFVASEIGEALPHWEAALYLGRPEQLQESARLVRKTLVFMIASALVTIVLGGWLVAADVRRKLALAQQKTDFVSNVSHELKTPLTSIRMFAELMQNGRGDSTAKHPQYLRIIMVEAERLTRLINNVLDFARLERKQKQFDKRPLDLHAVVERTWEGHALHLQESGFTTGWQAAPGPYPVIGDEDALAQILVNLLSNAEKYAGEHKEVELQTYLDSGYACVSVLDRGLGVPAGDERKIFESFYRAHDSLSSGIQGSGLGLTLAQQLAREHGGEIIYQPRDGGGSNFTLRVPLQKIPNNQ